MASRDRPAGIAIWVAMALPMLATGAGSVPAGHGVPRAVEALLEAYCFDCHGDGMSKGGVALDGYREDSKARLDPQLWQRAWRNLDAGLMPPAGKDQPSAAERRQIQQWIVGSVFRADPRRPDPGRVTIRRLNREEYRHTVFDLLGVDFATDEAFPADDTGYGFDTVGDAMGLSPLLLEKYLEAAQQIARKWGSSPSAGGLAPGPAPADAQDRERQAEAFLRRFAGLAYRRPAEDADVRRLLDIARAAWQRPGVSYEEGLVETVAAVLCSPRFLFRAERQPSPDDPGRVVQLDEYALASRLSYFLWCSTPDQELLDLAGRGRLRAEWRPQVDRLLADPRSERFVRNFVGQWLQTRDVESAAVDARRILGLKTAEEAGRIFNAPVRHAMRRETELLFAHLLRSGGGLCELITADFTFVNDKLAAFYGIPGVSGPEMRRVDLGPKTHRRGILTHGSFLVVSSNPNRTSPVKRGQFVLDNLLGTPAPPPPVNVPPLEASARDEGRPLTMREMMVKHREDPLCASCHRRMDPIGLALERFDAVGRYREQDQGRPIETAGELITGEKFSTVEELADILTTSRRRDLYRCATEKMLTFALGRGMDYHDTPLIDRIATDLEREDGHIRALIDAVVQSAPFQMRRGDGGSRDAKHASVR